MVEVSRARAGRRPSVRSKNCVCSKIKRGWDGDEEFESTYEIKELYLPDKDKTHAGIISGSTMQTATVTMQGIQAIYNVISMLFPLGGYFMGALGGLFVPIALLGLVRLPAAPWLSTNYALIHIEISHGPSKKTEYCDVNCGDRDSAKTGLRTEVTHLEDDGRANTNTCTSTNKNTNTNTNTDTDTKMNLRPESDWCARLYRIWWALSMGALALLCLIADIQGFWIQEVFSATIFVERLMYLVLIGGLFLIHVIYILKRRTRTTIIPCIGSLWYTIYTYVLIFLAVVCFVLACLETRIISCGSNCGSETTFPKLDIECPIIQVP
jgi:hypothetical protein